MTVNRAERSSAELAQDIVHEAQDLVQLELQLAKQELKELAMRNGIAFGLLAFGTVLLVLAVLVVLPMLLLVVLWDQHVLGALIWLGGYVVVGAALLLVGRLLLRLEAPRRTLSSLEETKRWALRQIRSSDR
ncbi:MAG: phage holin family protein [Chloroflexi bacterium]|nr:MAG: phage holin family protein [Chloroflexota bacterium]